MKAEARFDLLCLAFSDSDSDLFIKYQLKQEIKTGKNREGEVNEKGETKNEQR